MTKERPGEGKISHSMVALCTYILDPEKADGQL
jgi:hypothetical protein